METVPVATLSGGLGDIKPWRLCRPNPNGFKPPASLPLPGRTFHAAQPRCRGKAQHRKALLHPPKNARMPGEHAISISKPSER